MTSEDFEMTALKQEALVTNSYYMLMEAADMMCRQMEVLLNARKRRVKGKIRQRHNYMMEKVVALRNLQEDFWKDYHEAFGGAYQKTDSLRESAAYMARIMLLIADRCYTQEDNGDRKKERMIEEYIYFMPEGGLLKDDFLKRFVIR